MALTFEEEQRITRKSFIDVDRNNSKYKVMLKSFKGNVLGFLYCLSDRKVGRWRL